MSTSLGLSCVSLALLVSVGSAQSPNFARPTTVPAGQFFWESASPGLPGVALSPDGRLLISARFDHMSGITYPDAGWWAAVLRPEVVTQDASGIPQFPSVPLFQGGQSAWSFALLVEHNDVLPNATPTPTPTYPTPNHMFIKQWLAMCPDPAFASRPCPFLSDLNGNPGDPGTPSGQFETYHMLVVAADQWNGLSSSSSNNFLQPTFVTSGGVNVMPIGMRTLRVTVSSPQTVNAAIALDANGQAAINVSANFDVLQWQSASGPQPIVGIEPTLSRDGHLLVFQGNVVNQTVPWNSPPPTGSPNVPPYTRIEQLMYSFNPTAGVSTGWSEPHPINEMNSREANRIVNGMRFVDRYPIAAQPLVNADGTPLTQPFAGAYPWLTIDGTDLVCSAARNGAAAGAPIRRGASIIGRSTGYALRHIDGPLNPDRDLTDRILTTGSGPAPGAWRWGGDKLGLPLPYTRQGTVISLFDAQMRRYDEISLREKLDGDYLVAWDMNELIHEDPTLGWRMDNTRTADTSGNFVTGTLSSGAFFPADTPIGDVNYGAVGRSVIMTGGAAVTGSGGGVLASARPALSIECWFQQLYNAQPAALVSKAGSFELAVDPQGLVRVTLVTTAGTLQTPWVGPVQTVQDWRHVAFSFDCGAVPRLFVYVDGLLVHTAVPAAGAAVVGSTTPLVVGPAGINVGGGGPPGGYVAVDQLLISRVARTADEIERDAFRPPAPSTLTTLPTAFVLPTGLDVAETRVPLANVPSRQRIDLGELLFKDPGLSPIGVSCSQCHNPSQDFTDGIKRRPGISTGLLLRNAQTVLNRVFSIQQFWDGRAATLEDQVLHPLFNPDEMQSSKPFAMNYVSSATSPNYTALFQAAYGGATIDTLQQALASYERAVVAGNSRADQFEAGNAVLTASEKSGRDLFFGKARCFGCHTGSDYSDERFHVALFKSMDGSGSAKDLGRGAIDGRTRDLERFKTPTLRNLANTAPYFHDGSAATLLDVVNAYDAGSTLGSPVDEEIFPLGLTSTEKLDLVAFLLSLSGGWQKL